MEGRRLQSGHETIRFEHGCERELVSVKAQVNTTVKFTLRFQRGALYRSVLAEIGNFQISTATTALDSKTACISKFNSKLISEYYIMAANLACRRAIH